MNLIDKIFLKETMKFIAININTKIEENGKMKEDKNSKAQSTLFNLTALLQQFAAISLLLSLLTLLVFRLVFVLMSMWPYIEVGSIEKRHREEAKDINKPETSLPSIMCMNF